MKKMFSCNDLATKICRFKRIVSANIISKSTKPLKRKGLKQNYLLAYTGKLGDSKQDLKKLFNLGKIHRKSKFVDIKLQQKFIQNTSRFLKVGMDISDGLFSDLSKLAQINGMGFKFFKSIIGKLVVAGKNTRC